MTDFRQDELSDYARSLMFIDTRQGIMTLSRVLFLLLAASAALYSVLGYEQIYIYSFSVLAVLALHMSWSVRVITETRVMYLLATTLLVIIGVAMVLLAHQTGSFDLALFASVVLLFLVMPLVPWGLREALVIIALVYLVFTASTLSVSGRFDIETLWVLQFIMIGASITTLIVIARNIVLRRNDIATRYELKVAHDRMELLSLRDPLTGAWNRRFLEQNFHQIINDYRSDNKAVYFAIVDINDFKPLNDTYGHDFGDLVLCRLVDTFIAALDRNAYLVRMGGDEFAILMSSDDPKALLQKTADQLHSDPELKRDRGRFTVNLSIGVVEIPGGKTISLDQFYQTADQVMYQAKQRKQMSDSRSTVMLTRMD